MAAPVGGQVNSGDASINQSGLITTINQTSQHANINWNSFNVGENETVNFVQPNSNSSTLNQIHDANPSSILGAINANGRVFLSNSNGFIFGANSAVNVGSLFATTSQIDNLSDSNLELSAGGQGSIINQGNINTESGGYIAFFTPSIENTGTLNSPEGNITLSNANSGVLYLPDSAGIGFTIDSLDSLNPIGIENTGTIKASGGQVLLSSAAIDTALRSAINNQGIIDVSAIHQDGGDIRILASAGSIDQAGILNADSVLKGDGGNIIMIAEKDMIHSGSSSARGGDESGDGGFVETSSSETINLNSSVNTRALNGAWGTWRIDPDYLILGDVIGTNRTSAQIIDDLTNNGNMEYIADIEMNITGGIDTNSATGVLTLTSPLLKINSDISTGNLVLNGTSITISSNINLTASNTLDVNGVITATSGALTLTATNLNINEDIAADSIDLRGLTTTIKDANITATGEMAFQESSNLIIDGTSLLFVNSTGSLSLNGVDISGNGATDSLTLKTQNGRIDLRNMGMSAISGLNLFEVIRVAQNVTDPVNGNISISGDIYANTFHVTSNTTSEDQNFFLASATNIVANDISFENTYISGPGSTGILVLTAANSVLLEGVEGIASLNITTQELTLTDDISTQGDGISFNGNSNSSSIKLDKASGILNLTTRNTGNLIINSNITSSTNDKGLSLFATDGAIEINAISGVQDLTITNSSSLTTLNGDLTLSGNFSTDTSAITLNSSGTGLTISTTGNIDVSKTEFTTSDATDKTIFTASELKIGDITTGQLVVNSTALHLNGEINTSKETVQSLDLSQSGSILIENDAVLNGNLYLGTLNNETAINSLDSTDLKSLEINYDNQDMNFGDVGATTALQSFKLNGSGALTLGSTSTFSIKTAGNEGISLLGNLTIDLVEELNIDTSSNSGSGGDINLSGLNINGEHAISLKAGSGNIYLGTIGDTAAVKSFAAVNTGNIELFGNINNLENIFDFSNASSVILNDNITFGSSELYLASLLFGDASINGNFDLTIFSSILTLGEIGQNIALQNLNVNTLDQPIVINSDINTAGNIMISGGNLDLSSKLVSTGGEINLSSLTGIVMSADSELSAADSDITLSAAEGDISIAALTALNSVNITATTGSILNAIDDYTSNTSTSTNITAETINLTSGAKIGASIDSPIVINAGKEGSIKLSSGSKIYIANLENSSISSNNDIFDNSALTASANADILSQLKPETYNLTQFSQLEISDPIWQLDQLDHTFDSSNSSPRIYYSKKGWRLGNPKKK